MMNTSNTKLLVPVLFLLSTTAFAQDIDSMTNDQVRVAVQQICPVSGGALGGMGDPIKAKIGKEEVFLCCQGCVGKDVKSEHWATIHKNFASAQKVCAVMENKLPKKPEWTIVDGQIFFVCCPPCIEKIEADPAKYTAKLVDMYKLSLKPTN